MHDHEMSDEELKQIEQMSYEERDLPVHKSGKPFIYFMVFFVGCFIVAQQFMRWVDPDSVTTPGDSLSTKIRILPDADVPLIQSNRTAITDVEDLKQAERELLKNYSWVDKDAGKARIPVTRAQEIALAEGFPTRADAGVPEDYTK
jgi:hypothetical protein